MSDCSTALTIRLYGIVQGVGFRPFVSRIAGIYHITGSVANKGSFVEIHAQGKKENIEKFLRELKDNPPPRSMVLKTDILEREEIKEKDFSIIKFFFYRCPQ